MPVFAFGIEINNHEVTRPWRDRIKVDRPFLKKLAAAITADEFFLFRSKNDLTAFAVSKRRDDLMKQFFHLLSSELGVTPESLRPLRYQLEAADALRFFYKYSIGLQKSGEISESVKDFRDSFELSRELKLTGPYLYKLLQRGMWLAEKIRLEVNIQKNAITPETVVSDLAAKIFGDLSDHSALIVANSDFCEDFVQKLIDKNLGQLNFLDTNSGGSLHELCERFGGRQIIEKRLTQVLTTADLLLVFDAGWEGLKSTQLAQIMSRRHNAPLLLVAYSDDGASEALAEQQITKHYNLYYYNRSDLQSIVAVNMKEHMKTVELADRYIENEIKDFLAWVHSKEHYRFGDIIGKSLEMQKILELIARIAQTDITVLVDGESGTGKELVAQSIHQHSRRAHNPFVVVNCGALPETLLESELFGYVRGAFTGAVHNKKGLFEEANHGTVFLDEIGETSLATQVKLLRFLQEGEIKPVGSNRTLSLDVRLIAATNKNLEQLVKEGTFRRDLYYRLNVIQITIPPLRERKEDIVPLIEYFIKKYAAKMHKTVLGVTEEAGHLFCQYSWPGNVRELENAIERAIALCSTTLLTRHDLPPEVVQNRATKINLVPAHDMTLKDLEKTHIANTLRKHNWNYELVTRILGIGRTTLWRKMKEYNLSLNHGEER